MFMANLIESIECSGLGPWTEWKAEFIINMSCKSFPIHSLVVEWKYFLFIFMQGIYIEANPALGVWNVKHYL